MATRWGLIVQEMEGVYNSSYSAAVLEEFTGTREEALARLEVRARSYTARHPLNPVKTQLYRTDDGFLLISHAGLRGYGARFSLGELLHDSAEEKEAAKRRRAEQKAAERAAKREKR